MNQLFIFVLGLVLGGVVVFLFLQKKTAENPNANKQEKTPEKTGENKARNLESFNEEREKEREINKQKILELLKDEQARITNNDVEALLSVSDSTAERYLQELENEEKILQVGETGTGVSYKAK